MKQSAIQFLQGSGFWNCFFKVLILSFFFQGCLVTSCLNGGSCLPDNEHQTFSCSCQQSWTGDRCEVKKGNSEFFFLYHIKLVTPSTSHKQFPFYIKRSEFSVVLLQKKKLFCTKEILIDSASGQSLKIHLLQLAADIFNQR